VKKENHIFFLFYLFSEFFLAFTHNYLQINSISIIYYFLLLLINSVI